MEAELGHLALTRKPGEAITIGENIVVRLVESRNGKAKLLVTAPKSVRVLRGELITEEQCDDRTNGANGTVRNRPTAAVQEAGVEDGTAD